MAGIIRRQASDPLPLMAAMGIESTRPEPAEYLIPRLHLVMERPKYDLFHLTGCSFTYSTHWRRGAAVR